MVLPHGRRSCAVDRGSSTLSFPGLLITSNTEATGAHLNRSTFFGWLRNTTAAKSCATSPSHDRDRTTTQTRGEHRRGRAARRRAGVRFGSTGRFLGAAASSQQLGASWCEIEPGKAAYPRHYHCANEEAAFILEGEGVALIGNDRVAIRKGDFVAFPVGPETAHQIINTGKAPLRLLAMSTTHLVEIVGYPDSKKYGATARTGPHQRTSWVRKLFDDQTQLEYFEGEKVDEPIL